MRKIVTKFLWKFASLIPITLLKHLVKREVISIFYHAVSDGTLPHVRHLYPIVPVDSFKSTMNALKDVYTFITYDQLHEYFEHGIPLPNNAVHLSFDDGFSVCYNIVRPILLDAGISCTFFLTIDWIDNRRLYFRHLISLCVDRFEQLSIRQRADLINKINREFDLSMKDALELKTWLTAFREPDEQALEVIPGLLDIDAASFLLEHSPYLTSEQIKEMHRDGFTIGAHGLSHRKLGFVSRDDVSTEIVASCRAVAGITNQDVVPFSFPQSAGNVDRDQLAEIRDRNPFVGLLFDTKDLRRDVPFIINRVWAERPLTPMRVLHPLDEIISQAYRDAWVEGVLAALRKG